MCKVFTAGQLRLPDPFGMLLALAIPTPQSYDALLDVDLSNLSASSLGHAFRTGTPQMAAPQLLSGISRHPRDNRAACLEAPCGRLDRPTRPFADTLLA
jgi:hypothetical protein